MPTEHIKETDVLADGTVKLNKAIDQANKAEVDASTAKSKAEQALSKSEQTKTELDQAILAGDSGPLAGQLSVGVGGKVYSSAQERLIKENEAVTSQLAETETKSLSRSRPRNVVINVLYPPEGLTPAVCDWDFGTKTGTDNHAAIQAMIDYLPASGGKIVLPSPSTNHTHNGYKISKPLIVSSNTVSSTKTITIEGDGYTNTMLVLDNDIADSVIKYVNDNKKIATDVNTTYDSNVITLSSTLNLENGMSIYGKHIPSGALIVSVDSPTQITINYKALSAATVPAIFYKYGNTKNKVRLRNLHIRSSKDFTAFTTWHNATALDLRGANSSVIEDVRIDGFNRGIDMSAGWFSSLRGLVHVNNCRYGARFENACYDLTIDAVIFSNCGSAQGGSSIELINTGSSSINHIAIENCKQGLTAENVAGLTIKAGNIETVTDNYCFILKGLTGAEEQQHFQTSGVSITGVRFWNSLGLLILDGVSDVKFQTNNFRRSYWTPSNNNPCFHVSGSFDKIKRIDYANNQYYVGYEPKYHIYNDSQSSPYSQSVTENGIRYCNSKPTKGKFWQVGDSLIVHPPVNGSPREWVCIKSADGINDGTALWSTVGQVGYRTTDKDPNSTFSPNFIGEWVLNTATNTIYDGVATTGATYWKARS